MSTLAGILPWVQVGLAVLLIAAILFQQSDAGLGSAFGGAAASGWQTKRGLEKQLFVGTIILAMLFALAALVALFV